MKIDEILSRVDHTLLSRTATAAQIDELCRQALEYKTASVCVAPCYVKRAAGLLGGRVKVCTVIGFPNGYSTCASKCFETKEALENGADEIDMVINTCLVKDRDYDGVLEEIKAVRRCCEGKILKVIIETCLLDEDEKIRLCAVVSESWADFIKTSTGFAQGGATAGDVKILRKNCASFVKVKAAGGISSLKDAELFISLGADRLGTSRIVKIAEEKRV